MGDVKSVVVVAEVEVVVAKIVVVVPPSVPRLAVEVILEACDIFW